MKIGIVIQCCRSTGATRYAFEVSKEFAKAGHDVHIFANNWDAPAESMTMHRVPSIGRKFYVYEASLQMFSTLMMAANRFDVTMAQPTRYFTPEVAYVQFVYKQWANYKRMNGLPIDIADRYLSWIEGRNIRRAKKIIAMSDVVKSEIMENYGIPEDRIRVLYSGVDLKKFDPEKKRTDGKSIRQSLGLKADDTVLVLAGNPYIRKGLESAIRALPLIPGKDVKLLVMGRDSGNDKMENYVKLAEILGVSDRLVYGGFTGEIEKYYAAGDIFLFPTRYEPFGLVVLEAMASGLPVVVSGLAGAAELVEDGKEGKILKNPKDEREIAAAVNDLLQNGAYKIFGKNARLKAKKYPWSRLAGGMMEVFEEVKGNKR